MGIVIAKMVTLQFGKHRGETLGRLALEDRGYLMWIARQGTFQGSDFLPKAAAQVLQETEEEAPKLDKYDLDSRYKQEYSQNEIEQLREWDRQTDQEIEEQERQYDEKYLACAWIGRRGQRMELYVFRGAESPISFFHDDEPMGQEEFKEEHIRPLLPSERANPVYSELVAVLDNGREKVGLTQDRLEALRKKLEESA